ncbi:hypothetical protein PR202_ga31632 [Eleusine coracana subsp. coracana]|uniref:Uncharacterized protein n=1 Tax=Eleusine coracana subsp. coracana TaxID=191504 RepID=A0AAV5DSN8_ELECO|nr:hypothetical protein PR202_ga31632 [Eleusine coracana subsp. coracana]
MTELVRHPEILAKAQHEVRSLLGDKEMVHESDLPLRLDPPTPLLVPRETTEPCSVLGCEIPAKTRVLVNAKAIVLDPAAWGAEAPPGGVVDVEQQSGLTVFRKSPLVLVAERRRLP